MKNRIELMISFIIVTFIVSIGISFAYFTANFTGGEDTDTITVTGGSMKIIYNGGADIIVENVLPSDNPLTTKTFTVTGNNTTEIPMGYKISMVVEYNDFSDEALKYKLISTNSDNNGAIIPSILDLTNIGSGTKNIELGVGTFDAPTGGNKVHTYNLEIYFPNADYNQNEDQEKEFRSYISIENYVFPIPVLLTDAIIAQDGGAATIEAKGTPNFNVINGTSGLYAAEDEYGTSYYYRGKKTELNNNLIWGGFQWKIVRINGDGSIRLIYNGTEEEFNTNGTVNDTGTNTQITTVAWNTTNNNDAKYVGFMYGGANGIVSTMRNGTTSAAATYNETSTNIKIVLDNWYQTNILGKPFENQVVNNLFCNDRQLESEVGGAATGPGYGNTGVMINYATYHRLYSAKTPTLKCGQKNDRFVTTADITLGNGAFTYPIGLITADEAAMAGLKFETSNSTNYLYTNKTWWLFSPYRMYSIGSAHVLIVYSGGDMGNSNVADAFGARPAVSIISEAKVTGTGSYVDPYKVV